MIDTKKFEQLKTITDRFIDTLHDLYGYYFDSVEGFKLYHKASEQELLRGIPRLIIANGTPAETDAVILHSAPMQEIVERNNKEGSNTIRARQFVIVMIMGHWNEDIRRNIEIVLGMNKGGLKSDIMGDLDHMRNDILKNKGKARDTNSAKNKIIKFQENDPIYIDLKTFQKIFSEIFKYLNDLFIKETGQTGYIDSSLNLKAKEWHRSTKHVILSKKQISSQIS